MIYDVFEVLRVLVDGGFFVVSALPDGGREVHLVQFLNGLDYDRCRISERYFYKFYNCGIVQFWRSGWDNEGRLANFYFLTAGEGSPLSK